MESTSWDRLPEEPSHWFARFCAYLEQKPPRSVLLVYRTKGLTRHEKERQRAIISTSIPSSWWRAKTRFRWEERAAAFDRAEQERLDRELAEQREAERREELRIAAELRQKARELLALPVLVETVKRDRNGEEIAWLLIPEFRAFKAASDMFGQAKNHARAALLMPDKVERQEVTGKDGGPVETTDVGLTPEERLDKLVALAQQVVAQREQYAVH